jgi:hypothetical protein
VGKPKALVKRRPAETVGVSLGAVVGGVLALFNVNLSPTQVGGVVVLLGAVPGVITWLKTR